MKTSPHIAELRVTIPSCSTGLSPRVLRTDSSNLLTGFLVPTTPNHLHWLFSPLLSTEVYM